MDSVQRFWSYVDRSGECWNWTRCINRYGYGNYKFNGKTRTTHRIAYELVYGPIPDGLFVCHRCDNPACCNPDHLFLGTNQTNTADRHQKGRDAKGDRHGSRTIPESIIRGADHPLAKLTPQQVRDIREAANMGETYPNLAKRYNTTTYAIYRVVKRQSYKNT